MGPVRIRSANCIAGDHDECATMVEQDVAELGITDCLCDCHADDATPITEPVTQAGRALLDVLNRFRDWSADPNVKQVLVDMDLCIVAIEAEARSVPQSEREGLDVDLVAEVFHAQRLHPLTGACSECRTQALWFVNAYRALAAEYARLASPAHPDEE